MKQWRVHGCTLLLALSVQCHVSWGQSSGPSLFANNKPPPPRMSHDMSRGMHPNPTVQIDNYL